jgi:DNA-binding transcriptional regulator YiaG
MAGHKPWSALRKKMTPAQRGLADDLYRQKKLGLLVSEIRESVGLTQAQFAEKLGIGQPRCR